MATTLQNVDRTSQPPHPEVGERLLAAVRTAVVVTSLVLLRLAWGYFFSRSGDFAEER